MSATLFYVYGPQHVLVHAGIPPMWSYRQALKYAAEVESVMQGKGAISYVEFFRHMYGNEPGVWREDLQGMDRLRAITNFFTRMRLLDGSQSMNFSHKGALNGAPEGLRPWYRFPAERPSNSFLVTGPHWKVVPGGRCHRADTGCVWGAP